MPEVPPVEGRTVTGVHSGRECFELRVLRLVAEGAVSNAGGGYVHQGHPVSGELAAALTRLSLGGCLAVGASGPGVPRPVSLTPAGTARRADLGRAGGDRG